MKRIFTFLIAILLIGNVSFAQQRVANKDGNYEGVIRVKVSENAVK
jgi:myosin heavy subunit